jgi:hypothetical protein
MLSLMGRPVAAVLAGVLLSSMAPAAEQWVKLTSSHFELYTTAGEKKGREALLYFEQVRDFFTRTRSSDKPVPDTRVRIIAFQSEKEYAPYRINDFSSAFYLNGYGDDYIVMKSISAENYPVTVHEYTHLLIQHSGIAIAPWLNEGLAELYSTLKPIGKEMAIGQVIPGRYYYLQRNKWLPLETLLAVDHKSPYYNERDRANIFYAESWALVHMLILSPEYRPHSDKLLASIGSGASAGDAFWQAYAKTTTEVQKDLEQYMRRTRFNAVFFNIKLEKSAEDPDVAPASRLESGMVLADLLAFTQKREEAKQAYYALLQEFPKSWEPEAGLAELAWREKQLDGALTHFARAEELGSTSPRLYYDYARVAPDARARIPLLKKAIALDPSYQDAHRYLASCLLQDHQYQNALDQLGQLKSIKADQAFSYYHEWAYASLELEKLDDAQKAAEAARKYARSLQETSTVADLLHDIANKRERRDSAVHRSTELAALPAGLPNSHDADERPIIRRAETAEEAKTVVAKSVPPAPPKPTVRGALQQIDCLGKTIQLRVLSDGKTVTLAITDPQKVTIKGSSTGTIDLTCGPQKAKAVILEYTPRADAQLGTVGVVTSIEFR